ncbi:CorA family divalent cation transporter [Cellulomonas sp.]|uniref:CorA family divalent cation transporter n=1 Tax=Cellulomonas sp. TaxID=40001 RepID=UPI002D6217FF|nr:CorA family divalent cation transporter [Cellulomonas sp.]HYQ77233.1 CorA family divalent cation transporter [Cellulomonas sp.]
MERAWVHQGDGWAETDPDGLLALLAAPEPPVAWVHVDSLDLLADAARQAGVPESVVHRAVADHGPAAPGDPRRPQLRRLPGGGRYLVSPTLAYDGSTRDVTTGVWAALVVDEVTITAEEGPGALLADVRDHLGEGDHLPQDRESHVFAAVLMALVRRAGDVEMGIGEAVADVEQLVFSPQAQDPAEVVYDLKREIGEARRALVPLLSAFPDLVAEQEDAQRETRTMRWLRRLDTVLTKVDRHLDAHDALLGDMLSVHLSRVSVRQNEDMRKISAWAAIIAVPTLIAGVYGMNFDHMPELHWLLGYPASIVLMGAAAGLLFRLFKRSGWL